MQQIDIASLNDAVMGVIADFADEYEATAAVDYGKRCAALEPGSTVPKKGSIELVESQRHIESYAFDAQQKVDDACEKLRSKVISLISEPPSADALRLMQTMTIRGDSVSDVELDAMLRTYGGNYQIRRFVSGVIAGRSKYSSVSVDELDDALKLIDHAAEVGKEYTSPRAYRSTKMGKAALVATARDQLYQTGLAALGKR